MSAPVTGLEAELEAELEQALIARLEAEQHAEALECELKAAREETARVNAALQKETAKLAVLKREYLKLKESVELSSSDPSAQAAQIHEAREALKACQSVAEREKQRADALQMELDALRARNATLVHEEVERLQAENARLEALVAQLQRERVQDTKQLLSLQQQNQLLTQEAAELRHQLDVEYAAAQSAMQEQFRAAQQQITELRAQLERYTGPPRPPPSPAAPATASGPGAAETSPQRSRSSSVAAQAGPGGVHCGWMWKQGELVKSPRRRWFVLDIMNKLTYFEEPGAKQSKGCIDLFQVTDVRRGTAAGPSPHVLELCTAKRTYVLWCETADELAQWLAVLRPRVQVGAGGT